MIKIDLSKKHKTKGGYPVRNLRWEPYAGYDFSPIKGEVFINHQWVKGAWTDNGTPELWTSNKEAFDSLILVEISEEEYRQLIKTTEQDSKRNDNNKAKQLSLDF